MGATTRGQTNKTEKPGIVNPTLPENRPENPATQAQFVTWLAVVKESLLRWMTESRELAQDDETKTAIKDFTKAAQDEWKGFRCKTDEQTGDISDKVEQQRMTGAIDSQRQMRKELHKSRDTWRKFAEYRMALAAWEDFLYYQNVWNRKEPRWKPFFETAAERKKFQKEQEKAAKSKGPEKDYLVKEPKLGTPGTDNMDRTDLTLNTT